jgi:hypothetical protein
MVPVECRGAAIVSNLPSERLVRPQTFISNQ